MLKIKSFRNLTCIFIAFALILASTNAGIIKSLSEEFNNVNNFLHQEGIRVRLQIKYPGEKNKVNCMMTIITNSKMEKEVTKVNSEPLQIVSGICSIYEFVLSPLGLCLLVILFFISLIRCVSYCLERI